MTHSDSLNLLKYSIMMYPFFTLVQCDYATDVSTLINSLKLNYNPEARPQNTTGVYSTLVIFALNSVNIETETMAISGLIYAEWNDQRLAWDQTTNGISQIFMKPSTIWIPPLIVENEVNNVGVLGSDGPPLRVHSDGTVAWYPPVSTKTSCSADITYYPYDKQSCTLTLTGWSYSIEEMHLNTDIDYPIEMQFLSPSGEWDLINTSAKYEDIFDRHQTYRKIHYNIAFRRKWPYYAQNIILPIVLNSVLMAMVFAVPIESGEKMGYCLTVQLSYIVLLTMVSDDLPHISSQTSIIQMYLSIVLCIGTACIVCTTCILRIYNRDESDSGPDWLQTLTKNLLAPLVCVSCTRKRKISPRISNREKHPSREDSERLNDHYSSKEVATILDKFFFGLFALTLLGITCSFVGILLFNYNNL